MKRITRSERCIFLSTDIKKADSYPLLRVWFKTENETQQEFFFWIPKWEELYNILDKAIEVEQDNFLKSPWNDILKEIKKVLLKRGTKPFIRRKPFVRPKPRRQIEQEILQIRDKQDKRIMQKLKKTKHKE